MTGKLTTAPSTAPTSVKINALVRYCEFRGDHSAEIASAVEPREGETVAQFAARLHDVYGNFDVIEIRIVETRERANG